MASGRGAHLHWSMGARVSVLTGASAVINGPWATQCLRVATKAPKVRVEQENKRRRRTNRAHQTLGVLSLPNREVLSAFHCPWPAAVSLHCSPVLTSVCLYTVRAQVSEWPLLVRVRTTFARHSGALIDAHLLASTAF